MTRAFHTRQSLADNLQWLGVRQGDALFVHSSFKSLGAVETGAAVVVAALEDAVGPEGLILMPSFNLVDKSQRAETWDIESTPSTTGWLTEYFRTLPGTFRSDHYSHSVAARGRGAERFVGEHARTEGNRSPWDCTPWGATYGTHSPMTKACLGKGKILMIGVDYHSSTYVHFVEVLYWNQELRKNPAAGYTWLDRPKLGAYWDEAGRINRGKIGDADSRLFSIRDFVNVLLKTVCEDPDRWRRAFQSTPPRRGRLRYCKLLISSDQVAVSREPDGSSRLGSLCRSS